LFLAPEIVITDAHWNENWHWKMESIYGASLVA